MKRSRLTSLDHARAAGSRRCHHGHAAAYWLRFISAEAILNIPHRDVAIGFRNRRLDRKAKIAARATQMLDVIIQDVSVVGGSDDQSGDCLVRRV